MVILFSRITPRSFIQSDSGVWQSAMLTMMILGLLQTFCHNTLASQTTTDRPTYDKQSFYDNSGTCNAIATFREKCNFR